MFLFLGLFGNPLSDFVGVNGQSRRPYEFSEFGMIHPDGLSVLHAQQIAALVAAQAEVEEANGRAAEEQREAAHAGQQRPLEAMQQLQRHERDEASRDGVKSSSLTAP